MVTHVKRVGRIARNRMSELYFTMLEHWGWS